jgi:SAM-dependent methyltransferase
MELQQDRWNEFYKTHVQLNHDNWLLKYSPIFKNKIGLTVLDLGCGNGINLDVLSKWSDTVYAVDYSCEAIQIVNRNYKVNASVVDMRNGLPYKNNEMDIVISDLSLHYFSKEETSQIIKDIIRILKKDGILLARLNSIKDKMHGAQQGKEIEQGYYENNGIRKRFFTKEMIEEFFNEGFEILELEERTSGKYLEEKYLWEMIGKVRA